MNLPCYYSSHGDGSICERASELLVQSEGLLLGENNGRYAFSGKLSGSCCPDKYDGNFEPWLFWFETVLFQCVNSGTYFYTTKLGFPFTWSIRTPPPPPPPPPPPAETNWPLYPVPLLLNKKCFMFPVPQSNHSYIYAFFQWSSLYGCLGMFSNQLTTKQKIILEKKNWKESMQHAKITQHVKS